MNTPILFLIFNRPLQTKRVFLKIKEIKPRELFIASDGPRTGKEGEDSIVQETRDLVLKGIDWDCQVHTLFRDDNQGCKNAVSGAIDWFFAHVERGIILEDDCLPSRSFFEFCSYLLDKYEADESIGGITGDFRLPEDQWETNTYGQIPFAMIWGWATWRRAWTNYDVRLEGWSGNINDIGSAKDLPGATQKYFSGAFDRIVQGQMDTWDYQWMFTMMRKNQKFLHPCVNLISNIGFGEEATHTVVKDSPFSNRPISDVEFPMTLGDSGHYVEWLESNLFKKRSLLERAGNKARKMLLKG